VKLLVFGASDIFVRRVAPNLPALGVAGIEIVSRSGRRPALPPELAVTWRDDA